MQREASDVLALITLALVIANVAVWAQILGVIQ